jgi:DNA-binding GntR family transcriptional regulator
MRQLEQEGLVVRIPNRGCFVADFSEQDVAEIFSLRATLEMMAIELATPHLSSQDIANLREIIEAQREASVARDFNELTQLDLRFHEYICAKANHGRLLKTWRSQYVQALILMNRRFRLLPDYTPDTVVPDHTQIVAALERGDAQAAIELTKAISQRVTKECVEVIRRTEPEKAVGERGLRLSIPGA